MDTEFLQPNQWWMARLDSYGNATLIDGPHPTSEGANRAAYLHKRLGMLPDGPIAVAQVILHPVNDHVTGVDESSIDFINSLLSNDRKDT